ncbi:transporter substrate-binding domain-containing protein [Flammeovirga sp. MY04]|uniref:transglycosylase SLT domain-containing protein n=1 Tax=Flammeovirga sp. MY04 TaxID=1191459 RepID=UPI0008061AEB|nr:transporter substrate-binding domain-containing protein [Flammeovirga sp. MY04]ANQ48374.1 transporter substrate-binding domain-containing protein [Flammeovirga sp. MY04]
MNNRTKLLLSLSIIITLLYGCNPTKKAESYSEEKQTPPTPENEIIFESNKDLEDIKKRGKLIALTAYSSTSYYLYKGQTMGYEFELLKRLAEDLEVDLKVIVKTNTDSLRNALLKGEGDIIAYGLAITKDRQEIVDFTSPLMQVKQVLVQRKPENWKSLPLHKIDKHVIRNVVDLKDKEVHVRENTPYQLRLENLENEMGEDIKIVLEGKNVSTEELIHRVAEGQIDYTIADENIAKVNNTYYPHLDTKTEISFPQRIAWATRKQSPLLRESVSHWLDSMKKTTDYYVIYNKYFKNTRAQSKRFDSKFFNTVEHRGLLSKYDQIIKEQADIIGWDWRLLASLVYQESRFDPHAKSWVGAVGLMQLMPATAKQFGAHNPRDPHQNVKAGTKYLKFLEKYWDEIEDEDERVKFMLASYNAGQGHVKDAQRLAAKFNHDPNVWDGNVEKYMLLKSHKQYYRDEVVKFGYARGKEPVNYVQSILGRYKRYIELLSIEK